MNFEKLADLSLGLAALLGVLWIVLQIIKATRRNGDNGSSVELEKQLKEYFGLRFDAIAGDIKRLSDKGDKQDQRLAEFYEEFTELRLSLARRFGNNGHD